MCPTPARCASGATALNFACFALRFLAVLVLTGSTMRRALR
jgi:hypothetical protein